MNELLLLLAIVPIGCYNYAHKYRPNHKWLLTGITFGLVVAPVSLCLLQSMSFPVLGKILGLLGLVFNIIHGPFGYFAVVGMGLIEPGAMLSASQLTIVNVANGVLWGFVYGMVGNHFDTDWAEKAEPMENWLLTAGGGSNSV